MDSGGKFHNHTRSNQTINDPRIKLEQFNYAGKMIKVDKKILKYLRARLIAEARKTNKSVAQVIIDILIDRFEVDPVKK